MDSSKNEVLIAIMLGILLGFIAVVTFYFISKKNLINNSSQKTVLQIDSKNNQKDKSIVENFDLTINPVDSEFVSEVPEFTIKGTTSKNAIIVIQTAAVATRIQPDNDGNFQTTIKLENVVNQIFVTSILNGSEVKTIEKTILYEKKN